MRNYKLLQTSSIFALLVGCKLNAAVDNSDISNGIDPSGGAGGSTAAPIPGTGGASGSVGNAGNGGNPEVGGDAGSVSNAGVGGTAGGTLSDAGVDQDLDGGFNNQPDAPSPPDPVERVCNTPAAIASDKTNWFTTNAGRLELRTHWFQLTDAGGFSTDGCTYVGRIKWYHPETDSLGYTWYETGGLHDEPSTIFTINFTVDGAVADEILPSPAGDRVYPGTSFSYETCYFADLVPPERYSTNDEYQLHGCIRDWAGGHALSGVGLFRGVWDDNFSKPVLLAPLREQLDRG